MSNQVYIYLLTREAVPFYVGKTCNPKSRFKNHLKVYSGIEILVIEKILHKDRWQDRERFWIAYYRQWYKLDNQRPGGNGSSGITLETRLKMSESRKGKLQTQSAKDKLSRASKQDWEKRKRSGWKHPPCSPEHKKAISDAAKKRQSTPEARERMKRIGKSNKGKSLSEQTKQKIRLGVLAACQKKELSRFDEPQSLPQASPLSASGSPNSNA